MGLVITLFVFLSSNHVMARSLKATADKLGEEASRIGLGLSIFGIVLASIYFMLGRNDASTKMTQALLGLFVLLLAPSIVSFVRGLV